MIAMLSAAASAYAGAEIDFRCRHCGFRGEYVHGPLRFSEHFAAFCTRGHFTLISWPRQRRAPKPARFDRGAAMYTCPLHKTPTARRWDERECPRCGSRNFIARETGGFVD
jgi:DNA-directed RNA polymerase subunit RPC12/RpoP